jgi:adenosylmethionine-8-amino-7-oxononanoate aminotransferase
MIISRSGDSLAQLCAANTPVGAASRDAKDLFRARMRLSTLLQSFAGQLILMRSALFPRKFKKNFPIASRGEGCWIVADDGRRFLDASGQAAVVSIGHGVAEIGRAIAEQSSQIAFAHTSQFHTAPAEKLAERLLAMAPPNFRNGGRVYFTSGGSEATETAIKLARQFYLENGEKDRYRVISRRQSYHGSTLGAMSVSGNVTRRAPYEPLLAEWGHIAPFFCYN